MRCCVGFAVNSKGLNFPVLASLSIIISMEYCSCKKFSCLLVSLYASLMFAYASSFQGRFEFNDDSSLLGLVNVISPSPLISHLASTLNVSDILSISLLETSLSVLSILDSKLWDRFIACANSV